MQEFKNHTTPIATWRKMNQHQTTDSCQPRMECERSSTSIESTYEQLRTKTFTQVWLQRNFEIMTRRRTDFDPTTTSFNTNIALVQYLLSARLVDRLFQLSTVDDNQIESSSALSPSGIIIFWKMPKDALLLFPNTGLLVQARPFVIFVGRSGWHFRNWVKTVCEMRLCGCACQLHSDCNQGFSYPSSRWPHSTWAFCAFEVLTPLKYNKTRGFWQSKSCLSSFLAFTWSVSIAETSCATASALWSTTGVALDFQILYS